MFLLLLLSIIALSSRPVDAQGAETITYVSTTGTGCSATPCAQAGYQYIFDVNGFLVFVPNDTSAPDDCPDFWGFAEASTGSNGYLALVNPSANGGDSALIVGSYTAAEVVLTTLNGCTVTFNRGSNIGETSAILPYISYTGPAATCAPGPCELGGIIATVDVVNGDIAILSATSNATGLEMQIGATSGLTGCPMYGGEVTSGSTFTLNTGVVDLPNNLPLVIVNNAGYLSIDQNGNALSGSNYTFANTFGVITGSVGGNGNTVTMTNTAPGESACTYTFGAASPTPTPTPSGATTVTGHGGGSQSMDYVSTTGCAPSPCAQAGYQYIFDVNGYLVFTPNDLSTQDDCPDFWGFAEATSSTTGNLALVNPNTDGLTDSALMTGSYTSTEIIINTLSGCSITFTRQASSGSTSGLLSYTSYTGPAATCAPGPCETGGYWTSIDTVNADISLLSATSNATGNDGYGCPSLFGKVTSPTAFTMTTAVADVGELGAVILDSTGYLALTQAGAALSGPFPNFAETMGSLTGTLTNNDNTVVLTSGDGCSYTYTVAGASSSGYSPRAITAALATVACIAALMI